VVLVVLVVVVVEVGGPVVVVVGGAVVVVVVGAPPGQTPSFSGFVALNRVSPLFVILLSGPSETGFR